MKLSPSSSRSLGKFFILMAFCCVVYFSILGKKANNPDAQFALPALFDVNHPLEYLKMLQSFEVIDFQPVRDLSFFLDLSFYRLTGVVTFATFNVFLWGLATFLFLRLLERIVPEEKRKGAIYWALAFAAFPLFSQAVPWGMARKHILAFVLFLLATNFFLDWMEGKCKWFRSYLFYVAAGLTHPLTLLWPAWAFTHYRISGRELNKEAKKVFLIFFVTAATLLFTNYAYYTVGNTMVTDIFPKVSPELFNFPRIAINLGFYFRQIIFPYKLGFMYFPNFQNAWPGFVFLTLLAAFIYHERKDRELFSWLVFLALPFPIFLTLPGVFDQYLIIPVAGLFLIAFRKWNRSAKLFTICLSTLALGWGIFTSQQAALWVNPIKLNERNFETAPSCKSALNLALVTYNERKKAPKFLLNFLRDNGCFEMAKDYPEASRRGIYYIEALLTFTEEDEFPLEVRLMRLKALGLTHYYPKLIYAALLAQLDHPQEVEEVARFILEKTQGVALDTGPVIDDVLRPYCLEKNLPTCLQITVPKGPPGYL